MMPSDPVLQAQVDAQLLEQGAFSCLELLFNSGRLLYEDYEAWRRGELDTLDASLMGSQEKIRAELTQATQYARAIGLVEQAQEFFGWTSEKAGVAHKALRVSADAALRRLIGSRYVPAKDVPQMDLFFDNPVVALTSGIVNALCARNAGEAQRQLDRLYAQAPNHADLAAFDRLLAALGHLNLPIEDRAQELRFLKEIGPIAKRLLGSQSRDLLSPLWRQLADALATEAFVPEAPHLHRSYALAQAQDWPAVSESVLQESLWQQHAALCLRLAESGFYRQRRAESLTAWCHLCWKSVEIAAQTFESRRHPDAGLTALWQTFIDAADDLPGAADAPEPLLTAADFPAWLLIDEPGLALQLPEDLPRGRSASEEAYRCVHRWTQARRADRRDEEITLRKQLQADRPALFELLKRSVAGK